MKTLVMAVLVAVAMTVGCAGTEEPTFDVIGVEDTGFDVGIDTLESDEGSDTGVEEDTGSSDTLEGDAEEDTGVEEDATNTDVIVCGEGYKLNEDGDCELVICLENCEWDKQEPTKTCRDTRGFTCVSRDEKPCVPYNTIHPVECSEDGLTLMWCADLKNGATTPFIEDTTTTTILEHYGMDPDGKLWAINSIDGISPIKCPCPDAGYLVWKDENAVSILNECL